MTRRILCVWLSRQPVRVVTDVETSDCFPFDGKHVDKQVINYAFGCGHAKEPKYVNKPAHWGRLTAFLQCLDRHP
jgi:hypothetical protein